MVEGIRLAVPESTSFKHYPWSMDRDICIIRLRKVVAYRCSCDGYWSCVLTIKITSAPNCNTRHFAGAVSV